MKRYAIRVGKWQFQKSDDDPFATNLLDRLVFNRVPAVLCRARRSCRFQCRGDGINESNGGDPQEAGNNRRCPKCTFAAAIQLVPIRGVAIQVGRFVDIHNPRQDGDKHGAVQDSLRNAHTNRGQHNQAGDDAQTDGPWIAHAKDRRQERGNNRPGGNGTLMVSAVNMTTTATCAICGGIGYPWTMA
jgi:hypothetical protein